MKTILSILVPKAFAQTTMKVSGYFQGNLTVVDMIRNTANNLIETGWVLLSLVFLIGAFILVFSAGDEAQKGYAKGMMLGAIFGVAVIAGSHVIMNLVLDLIFNTKL